MGTDGWLGIGWPKEYGGQGRPATDQFIFFNEVQRARAPFPFVTLNTVGPMLMRHGTEEQKKFFLSGILAGEINCAIGYTEPGAGTDLASLRTRAVLDGDEWVINGNKVFTSGADQADFIWLAARTDPDAPKHKGISIFMVPTSVAGILLHPHRDGGRRGHHRLLLRRRAGAPDGAGGRAQRGVAPDHRPAQPRAGRTGGGERPAFRLWDEAAQWAIDQGVAECRLDPGRTWPGPTPCSRPRSCSTGGWPPPWPTAPSARPTPRRSRCSGPSRRSRSSVASSASSVPAGYLSPGSPGAALHGDLERAGRQSQINTFGGGVNEVQREILATAGLGMKRSAR